VEGRSARGWQVRARTPCKEMGKADWTYEGYSKKTLEASELTALKAGRG
jgi:hypothetical protein